MRPTFLLLLAWASEAFVSPAPRGPLRRHRLCASKNDRQYKFLQKKFSTAAADDWLLAQERDKKTYAKKRMQTLGAKDGEEYDLEYALAANTDDTITKIIVGALTVTLVGLLRGSGGRFGGYFSGGRVSRRGPAQVRRRAAADPRAGVVHGGGRVRLRHGGRVLRGARVLVGRKTGLTR